VIIYFASKTKHAQLWQTLRLLGTKTNSSWIDEAGVGESKSLSDLWIRCVAEASSCDILIAYRERGEELKGTLIEIGCALTAKKPVILVGDWPHNWSFRHHPLVVHTGEINYAIGLAERIYDARSKS
jgi:hypothetical protein